MPLNKRLLRKVRNRIAKIPESYEQSTWMEKSKKSPCGAVACLAGKTIICNAPDVQTGIATLNALLKEQAAHFGGFPMYGNVPREAARLLGISESEATVMFDSGGAGWPKKYCDKFETAYGDSNEEAAIAVAYLDECLKRGKVTW